MNHNKIYLLSLLAFTFWGCEDDIFPDLEQAESRIVVDAWLTNDSIQQTIRITETLPYYIQEYAPGVENAVVYILEDETTRYDFIPSNVEGNYIWTPTVSQPVLGKIGSIYDLTIEWNGKLLTSITTLNRVPEIDSVTFSFHSGSFIRDSYFGEFFSRDPLGVGDTYWIKSYKNGDYLNQPHEINVAFDAATSAGANVDGLNFIQPIRNGVNPLETDDNDEFISPFDPGDSLFVELYSISNEAFYFLTELRIQTDRPGGFAELFAVPLSNISTNIFSDDQTPILGFFNMSAVSRKGGFLDPDNLPAK